MADWQRDGANRTDAARRRGKCGNSRRARSHAYKRKVQRDFDKDAYKARHVIENLFCKLKQYRAIATRYDKTARNVLAAIHLAAAVIWLN